MPVEQGDAEKFDPGLELLLDGQPDRWDVLRSPRRGLAPVVLSCPGGADLENLVTTPQMRAPWASRRS